MMTAGDGNWYRLTNYPRPIYRVLNYVRFFLIYFRGSSARTCWWIILLEIRGPLQTFSYFNFYIHTYIHTHSHYVLCMVFNFLFLLRCFKSFSWFCFQFKFVKECIYYKQKIYLKTVNSDFFFRINNSAKKLVRIRNVGSFPDHRNSFGQSSRRIGLAQYKQKTRPVAGVGWW